MAQLTVTIDQAVGQADPTSSSPIHYTVVFSSGIDCPEEFVGGDVTLSGTANPMSAMVTEISPFDGTTFDVAVSGMTSTGTVIASLEAGIECNGFCECCSQESTSDDNVVNFVMDLDFGDAPDDVGDVSGELVFKTPGYNYATLLDNDGARHSLGSGLFLGASVDADDDGQESLNADGDDTDGDGDDEDGVTFNTTLVPGAVVNIDVEASGSGLLNAWMDFNGDRDFDDEDEQIFEDEMLSAGTNNLSFYVPEEAVEDITFARFRFNSSGDLEYYGLASDGEVEDYRVEISETDDDISFEKEFIPDLAGPGGTVILEFTITSMSDETLTDISFLDDLDFVVPGMIATNLPLADVCGGGSSLTGTSVISLTNGILGRGESCSFQVEIKIPDAPLFIPFDVYLNTTSPITATAGESEIVGGPAEDEIEIEGIPLLSKEFDDDGAMPGDVIDLTFTIMNTDFDIFIDDITFSDDLDAVLPGLIPDALLSDGFCGTYSTMSFADGVLTIENASLSDDFDDCSFTIPVKIPENAPGGSFLNVTSDLEYTFTIPDFEETEGTGFSASEYLDITAPALQKIFINNPVAPGETTTLEFILTNPSETEKLRNISFNDDLTMGGTLGLIAVIPEPGTLTDICGTGSSLSGTSVLSFSDGELDPGASCSFSVEISVPASAAPDIYTNTTSDVNAEIGGSEEMSGTPVVYDPASDDLEVEAIPLLTKNFTDDPVFAGETVNLEFKISNTDPDHMLTMLAFDDDLDNVVPGLAPTSLLPDGFCGGSATMSFGMGVLSISDASIPAGGKCTFSITLDVPGDAPAGAHLNETGFVIGIITERGVVGNPASDFLDIASIPVLSKSFIDDPAVPGGTVVLEFTIVNDQDNFSASDLEFMDDLNSTLTGLVATNTPIDDVCGNGSRIEGTDVLNFEGGHLNSQESCIFQVELELPLSAEFDAVYPNETAALTGTVSGKSFTGLTASDDLVMASILQLEKEFIGDPVAAGGTVDLEFTLTNNGLGPLTDIAFTDNLTDVLDGLMTAAPLPSTDDCGLSSILTGGPVIDFSMGELPASSSCSFVVSLQLPDMGDPGDYQNITSAPTAMSGGEEITGVVATDILIVLDTISIMKSFDRDFAFPGDLVDITFTITYAGQDDGNAIDITFTDDIGSFDPNISFIDLPQMNICGAGSELSEAAGVITLVDGTLTPQSECIFTVTIQIPDDPVEGLFSNVTSELTAMDWSGPLTGDPASDEIEIISTILRKEFIDDPAGPLGDVTLRFQLTNPLTDEALRNISFSDNVAATLSDLTVANVPDVNSCGSDAEIILSNGNKTINFSGGSLLPGESCSFDVELTVPITASQGNYANTTSQVTAHVGGTMESPGPEVNLNEASDILEILPLPLIEKNFLDNPVAAGGQASLEFRITNTSSVQLDNIAFTDDLDAALTGLEAMNLPSDGFCGAGSTMSGSSTISMTGGQLAAGEDCTFLVELMVPTTADPGNYINITDEVTGELDGETVMGNQAIDVLQIVGAPLLSKSFIDDPSLPGGSVTLEFSITNDEDSFEATNIQFTDNLMDVLAGLAPTDLPKNDICGTGSNLSFIGNALVFEGGTLDPSSSCSFSSVLSVPIEAVPGSIHTNETSELSAQVEGVDVSSDAASDDLKIRSDIIFTKRFLGAPVAPGGSLELEFIIENNSSSAVTDLTFMDDLDNFIPGLVHIGPNIPDVCGAGSNLSFGAGDIIELTGGMLDPMTSCTFSFEIDIPEGTTPAEYLNITTELMGMKDGETESFGSAAAPQTISELIAVTKEFSSSAVFPGDQVDILFTIEYAGQDVPAEMISFVDDLSAFIPGAEIVSISGVDNCGMAAMVTGTTEINFNGGELAVQSSCSFVVTIQIPTTTDDGNYTNTVTDLSAEVDGEPETGPDAVADLIILPDVDFGDAPSPYPTLLSNNGAYHDGGGLSLKLGSLWDHEINGQPEASAEGDDLDALGDDEDGVIIPECLLAGSINSLEIEVMGSGGVLNAWMDFNQNGSWLDAGEQIATNEPMSGGTNPLDIFIPAGSMTGTTFARFRLSINPNTQPTGARDDGEVEDYEVTIDNSDTDMDGVADICDICEGDDDTGDSDADGFCDDIDICPGFDDLADVDGDSVPDGCDLCDGDDASGDSDGDGVCDDSDICPGGDDFADLDSDGTPDLCDDCPDDPDKIEPGICGCGISDEVIPDSPGPITGPTFVCTEMEQIPFYVSESEGVDNYMWSYTGTGISINNQGENAISIDFSDSATGGFLTVKAVNCAGESVSESFEIVIASFLCALADCANEYLFVDNESLFFPNTPDVFQAIIGIQTDAVIQSGTFALMRAGQLIDLLIGFEVKENADFLAYIYDCTGELDAAFEQAEKLKNPEQKKILLDILNKLKKGMK